MPKKIGQLRFKYKDKCAAFNLKWKGIPEVRRAHEKGLKLVCWLVQQKFVSRPKSTSRNIRTGELSQERWSHAMECTIKSDGELVQLDKQWCDVIKLSLASDNFGRCVHNIL